MAPYSDQHELSCEQQRLPMRKPMSMVEYWVRTGRQPYTENINKSLSDSGSSLEEELIPEENLNLSKLPVNSSLEKNYGNSIVQNKNDKTLTNTSNSSVDTAVYIKANNNTTTKTETAAIIEGSKSFDNKSINRSQLKLPTVGKSNINHNTLYNLEYKNIKFNYFNDIIENKRYNGNNSLKKREHNETNVNSKTSKSDESMYRSKYLEYSQNSDLEKFQGKQLNDDDGLHNHPKRKKLYNSQDSAVEFTPVSDENRSYKMLKSTSNISHHPALQTPKPQSKFLFKKKRKSLKRKSRLLNALDTNESEEQSKSKLSQLKSSNSSCKSSKNLTKQLVSNSLYENEYKKYLEKSKSSSDKVFEDSFESKSDSFNNSSDSLKNKTSSKSFKSELNKSQKSKIQLNVTKNLEKKIDLSNGTSDSSNTLKNKNHYKVYSQHDNYAIVFSEDEEDEVDVNNDNFDIESSDDNKTIEQSEHFDKSLDETLKNKNNSVKKESKGNDNQSKTTNRKNKSKKAHKVISSLTSKKDKKNLDAHKEKCTNENLELVKSDKKVLSIVNKSKNGIPKTKEKIKNENIKPVKSNKKVSSIVNKSEKVNLKTKEQFTNKNIKPVKSEKKFSSILNKSEEIIPKNKAPTVNSENWKDKSFQAMKKIFKHTIVFSSSDESE